VSAPLLEVRDLVRHFRTRSRDRPIVRAVDGLSFAIEHGSILGIVGESGSGKSTLARLVMALDQPDSGRVIFENHDLSSEHGRAMNELRRGFQMVFQDPYASLDPRQKIERIVAEPLHLDARLRRQDRRDRAAEALAQVGLGAQDLDLFPNQFSGGQRQRIAIARALVSRPKLVVADEPVSSLDVSVQAQVLNLLMDLRDRRELSYLFISHNLAVVETLADRIAVMYRGRFVEQGYADEIFRHPMHPYTRRLIDAEPRIDAPKRRSAAGPASSTSSLPNDDGAGWVNACAYAARCPHAKPECRSRSPATLALEPGHEVTCHFAGQI
jgi:oligopeptide/dipeptide ABC transporter ATP-binding protein